MQIGPQIRSSIIQMIEGHLADYHKEINEAYENSGRALTFAFGVKLTAAKHGGTQIDVSLKLRARPAERQSQRHGGRKPSAAALWRIHLICIASPRF